MTPKAGFMYLSVEKTFALEENDIFLIFHISTAQYCASVESRIT